MANRYEIMRHLRDDLEELFRLCGVQREQVKIIPAPAPIRLAEKLVQDNALYHYLEGLDAQAEQAVRVMKDRRLDEWNDRQNEARITELEEELKQERMNARHAEETLAKERQAWAQREARYREEQVSVIQDLISLRDKLLLRKSWLEEQCPEEQNARKLADSQLRETARCLAGLGVEILEAGGSFDSRYQTVVETRPAETEEQADQIAETFRPGYRFRDEILRPQEVILFAAT